MGRFPELGRGAGEHEWLSELLEAAEAAPRTGAAFSRQIPRPGCQAIFAHDYDRCFGPARDSVNWDHFFSMVSCAVNRRAWEEQPFREDLQYAEDDEWSRRLKANGWDVVFAERSVAIHSHNYTLKQAYKRAYGDTFAAAATSQTPVRDYNFPYTVGIGSVRDALKDFDYCAREHRMAELPARRRGARGATAREAGWLPRRLEALREAMKILVVSNLYPPHSIGGYEERCRQIIDRLRARGHEVRVLTSTHGLNGNGANGAHGTNGDSHVHRRLRIHGFFGHPWLGIAKLFGLEKHNCAVLRNELREFQPDVVHVWNLGGVSKALTLTLQQCGVPVIYDVSDHWIARSLKADVWLRWWNGDSGGRAAKMVRGALKASGLALPVRKEAPFGPWEEIAFKRIYFCSEALKRITMAKGYALGHADVIYCGIETGKFAQRPANERFTRLLYVGRLAEDKDPLTAIRAMKLLPAHFTLSLFGRGDAEYTEMLRKEAAGLGARVEFKSASAREMAGVYAEYDALLFTSAWEEPFALTPLGSDGRAPPRVQHARGRQPRTRPARRERARFSARATRTSLAEQVLRLEREPELRRTMVETARREVGERTTSSTSPRRSKPT